MGGSKSSTTKTTANSTTNTSTNITQIGSLGFTGQDAVALAGTLEQGSLYSQQLLAAQEHDLVQASGDAYSQLIGGASELVRTGAAQNADSLRTIGNIGHDLTTLASTNEQQNASLIDAVKGIAQGVTQSNRDTLATAAALGGSRSPDFSAAPSNGGSGDKLQLAIIVLGALAAVVTIAGAFRKR
jgi:hypothetical protein